MKSKHLENAKTFILAALIISSLFFTYRLWFKDHNLFSILGIFDYNRDALRSQQVLENVYTPPKILINFGESSHVLLSSENPEYSQFQREATKLIKQTLLKQSFEVIEVSEWDDILSSKSILLGFEVGFDSQLLLKLYNVSNADIENNISKIQDILIVQDNTVSENIKCFIKGSEKNKMYKFKFSYDDSDLTYLLNQIEAQNLSNYITGYELKHKLLKDDVLILPTDESVEGKRVRFENEVDIESTAQIRSIAQKFFENINVVKTIEYKDENKENIIQKEFIDRKRILRIYKNGLIEYTSAELANDQSQYDEYSALRTAVDFIQNNLNLPNHFYLSEIKQLQDSTYYFGFDYSIEGLKVKINNNSLPKHAIEIEVKGNIVNKYRRFIKKYDVLKQRELDLINLKAIDQAISLFRKQTNNKEIEKSVSKVELVYVDDGVTNDLYPYWFIRIDNEDFLINSIDKEH